MNNNTIPGKIEDGVKIYVPKHTTFDSKLQEPDTENKPDYVKIYTSRN